MTLAERVAQYQRVRSEQGALVSVLEQKLDQQRLASQQVVYRAYSKAFLETDLSRDELRDLPNWIAVVAGSIVRCEGSEWVFDPNSALPESDVVVRTKPVAGERNTGAFLAVRANGYR